MKKTRLILIVALVASLGILVPGKAAVSQQTAGELFEKALYVEEGQGDLQKAIGFYQDIVKKFTADRETAAKALLHIAIFRSRKKRSRWPATGSLACRRPRRPLKKAEARFASAKSGTTRSIPFSRECLLRTAGT
jgi:hypothetical protein